MAGFSNYLIGRILDRTFGGRSWTPPSSVYIALFTVMPDDDDAGGTECTGGSYARAEVANNGAQFPDSVLASGVKFNGSAITFATPSASWGDVVAIGVYDGPLAPTSRVFTVPAHADDKLVSTAHGFVDGDLVYIPTVIGTVPAGLAENTDYYVRDATANDFKLAETPGGAAIDITSAGSGTLNITQSVQLLAVAPISTRSVSSGVVFSIPAATLRFTLTGYSDYLNKAILDHVFGIQTFAVPELHCALFTVAPDSAGAGGTECTGGNYARQPVTNDGTNFPNASNGSKSNALAITFSYTPSAPGWGSVVAEAVYDAASGGNLLLAKTISTTAVASGSAWVIPAAALRLSMS